MERLTKISKITDLPTVSALCESCGEGSCADVCEEYGENGCAGCPVQKAISRLSAYEDTGLEPSEILELNDFANSQCAKLLAKNGELERALEFAKSNMAYIATTRNICAVCRHPCKEDRVHCAKFEWGGAPQKEEARK